MQPDPVENLLIVLETVQAHAPPDVAAWFDEGMAAYFAGGRTLDAALGLNVAAGERSAVTQYRDKQRQWWLEEAWDHIDPPDLPATPRSEELATAIRKFQAHSWPNWCEHESPPPGTSQLRAALFMARKHGGPLPESWRRLYDLLSEKMQ